ncbi:unnamed protein product [Spodoptera exigua]|nr:unnamed protein product [Spodoptera exigua]
MVKNSKNLWVLKQFPVAHLLQCWGALGGGGGRAGEAGAEAGPRPPRRYDQRSSFSSTLLLRDCWSYVSNASLKS